MYINDDKCVYPYKTAVALGLFDGVHSGHQAVISEAVGRGNDKVKSAVFTFKTNTMTSKAHDGRMEMLLTDEVKQQHFEDLGVDYLFSPEFSKYKDMTDEEFVKNVLKDKLNACFAVCGEDFRFGRNAMGDAKRLKELGGKYGFEVCVLKHITLNGQEISSTKIRELIRSGEIAKANKMLGYNYGYKLPVEHGFELGRTWDFPTINQIIPKGIVLPKFGVYCTLVNVCGRLYKGVTNIGIKPTVKVEIAPLAETYIIDFNGDLYGKAIEIELCEFVRPEKSFDTFSQLREEIARNIEFAKDYFDRVNN
ncbi:MAG: bifunctional riboflavin kinase/FAD synthetase [Ruminococcus sp.]|nr:bifunctional riboflavin kinase/FAD synthetase [Ruminococcus sp.]